MPRRKTPQNPLLPYHITARCSNKEWFQLPLESVWEVMCNYLYLIHQCYDLKISAFVLMNNHIHLIVRDPSGNLSIAMNYFMRETSRVLGFETARINQIWGGPFHRSQLETENHEHHAYKYLYRNPVEARLVERVEDYPFSSLGILLGQRTGILPLEEDRKLFPDVEQTLRWLNDPYLDDHRELVRGALRKSRFKFRAFRTLKQRHLLENDLRLAKSASIPRQS